MPNLPLYIDMHDRVVLVVGGGPVAARKARVLLDADAIVRVVTLRTSPEMESLAASDSIVLRVGQYDSRDLNGVFLVVAATDDSEANLLIAAEAKLNGILVVMTEAPELGDCFFPAVHRCGNLEISVSSGGRCPAFAGQVRNVIAGLIGDEYGVALEHLALEREKLLTEGRGSTYNSKVMRALAQRLIAELSDHKESS